jgi:hypothetical protein
VLLPGTALPAHADEDPPRGPNVENIINAVFIVLDMLASRHASPSQFRELASQLVGAVKEAVPSAQEEIKNHIDAKIEAEVNGYLTEVKVEMVDFDAWFDEELVAYSAAARFAEYASATKAQLMEPGLNEKSINAMGFTVNVLYANAVAVRDLEVLGLPKGGTQLLVDQIEVNKYLKNRLAPICNYVPVPAGEGVIEQYYECKGVDGTVKDGPLEVFAVGTGWLNPPISDAEKTALADQAGAKTSWAVAVGILPQLEDALAKRGQ